MQDNRTTTTDNNNLLLFAEVDGICPNCTKLLIYEKNGKKFKRYEIAHIYPLNPTPEEVELLKNEERLNDNPNHSDNLICLCGDCHTIFDKPRTIQEYRDLVAKKKELIKIYKAKTLWEDTKLELEIFEVINLLSDSNFEYSEIDILSYDPKTINSKTNDSITNLTKRNIHRNVQEYYNVINAKFKELDFIIPTTTETISTQIRAHYLSLVKQDSGRNQKEIFDAMVSWISKITKQKSYEAAEIVVSYFIQNCEIYS